MKGYRCCIFATHLSLPFSSNASESADGLFGVFLDNYRSLLIYSPKLKVMNTEKTPTVLSATSINGTMVLNEAMETIGSIEDLMIDLETGEVNYAVLSVDTGFLNMGSKYFAIPLEEFDFKPTSREAMLKVDKNKLENSPGFDKDNWPKGPQNEFVKEVHTFYGRKYPKAGLHRPDAPSRAEHTTEEGGFAQRGGFADRTSVSEKSNHASTNPNVNIL